MQIKEKMASLLMVIGLAISTSATAAPITVYDSVPLYSDLAPETTYDLSGFNLTGSVNGPATLHVRYGLWTGTTPDLSIKLIFGGTDLISFISNGAYYSNPAWIDIDVSTLVTTGMNTLSVFATIISGSYSTYSLGEISLTYNDAQTSFVPEPRTLALIGLALAGLTISRRRRKI